MFAVACFLPGPAKDPFVVITIGYYTLKSGVKTQANPRGSFVDKVTLGQVFLGVLLFSLAIIIPPKVHTHSFIHHRSYIISAIDSVVT